MHIFPSTSLTPLLAQAEGAPPGMGLNFLVLFLLLAGMWFLLIAPQRKRQKEHDQMVKELKSGDEVITSGGIYGTVVNVKSDRFVIKVAEDTRLEISKPAVASVINSNKKDGGNKAK